MYLSQLALASCLFPAMAWAHELGYDAALDEAAPVLQDVSALWHTDVKRQAPADEVTSLSQDPASWTYTGTKNMWDSGYDEEFTPRTTGTGEASPATTATQDNSDDTTGTDDASGSEPTSGAERLMRGVLVGVVSVVALSLAHFA